MSSLKIRGQKREGLIVARRIGHRVLLFGDKVLGDLDAQSLQHENATIETVAFPSDQYSKLGRLAEYTLVILDYAAFITAKGSHVTTQEVFEKQMIEALDAGTTFCFLHYNEFAPRQDPYGFRKDGMSSSDIEECRKRQIGFGWLDVFSIRPLNSEEALLSGTLSRGEFKAFLDKWGASHNYFRPYGERKFDDVILGMDEFAFAFMLKVRNGRVLYVPFQRDFSRKEDLKQGLQTLIDCLLTYITKSITETPVWGQEPFFKEEGTIRGECEQLQREIEIAFARLRPFEEAKALLFQAEYVLERNIPTFLGTHLGITTDRDEKYKEDFWILNDNGEKAIIVETKSMIKGFKKSAIFSLFNHREANKLNESFPALLIANCNLQAASWSEKDRAIDRQDYEVAAQNNILILRVEDLLRLWDAVRHGILDQQRIMGLLLSMKGWLHVSEDFDVRECR